MAIGLGLRLWLGFGLRFRFVTMETPSDPEGLVTGNLLSHYMAPYVIFGRTVVFRLRTSILLVNKLHIS